MNERISYGMNSFPTHKMCLFFFNYVSHLGQPNGVVVREAGCCTKGPGFKSRDGCQTIRPGPPPKKKWLSGSALKDQ